MDCLFFFGLLANLGMIMAGIVCFFIQTIIAASFYLVFHCHVLSSLIKLNLLWFFIVPYCTNQGGRCLLRILIPPYL